MYQGSRTDEIAMRKRATLLLHIQIDKDRAFSKKESQFTCIETINNSGEIDNLLKVHYCTRWHQSQFTMHTQVLMVEDPIGKSWMLLIRPPQDLNSNSAQLSLILAPPLPTAPPSALTLRLSSSSASLLCARLPDGKIGSLPFLSPTPSTQAQSKERKGSNFAA